nr:ATP-binding cassette domain-containing protein [Kineosporia rhizophila]
MSANRLHRLTTAVRLRGVQVETDSTAGLSALQVRDLSVTSGTLVAVQGRSANEVHTLLLTLAGRVALAGGSLEIAGSPVSRRGTDAVRSPEPWRRRVGFVDARPVLFGHLSVAGNIGLPVRWSGKRHPREEIGKLCRSVGLDAVKDCWPAELDPAEQQRVAIAMALAYDPDLLVVAADPGSAGLDQLSRTLVDLVRLEGRTIVTSLATPIVQAGADQVLTLLDGRPIGTNA